MRYLVTGAQGSIGSALVDALPADTLATDTDTMDVTDSLQTRSVIADFEPDVIFHLAGAKHAPQGEEDPWQAAEINIIGTDNVLETAAQVGARVITASTCKACNPETAYGATKLIAERMTLNAGGSVARFYNVIESCGNVFELWRAIPEDEPIPVTPCARRFMSLTEAVHLLLACIELPPGRYSALGGVVLREMKHVARVFYPEREQVEIPPRRGDRLIEPAYASCEKIELLENGIMRVVSPHDSEVSALVGSR